MAISSNVRPSYSWRMLILGVLCIVFGLWGVYDYVVAIPAAERLYDRYHVLQLTRDALETQPNAEDYPDKKTAAIDAVVDELEPMVEAATTKAGVSGPARGEDRFEGWLKVLFVHTGDRVTMPARTAEEPLHIDAKSVVEVAQAGNEYTWFRGMLLAFAALNEPRMPGAALAGLPKLAYDFVKQQVDVMGTPEKPNKFDRLTQWAFILCLPCAPYFFVLYRRAKQKTYRLEDDGSLVTPESTWPAAEIADIDMSKWMAKSVATVRNTGGSEIKLDDYLYKGMHLIIGALAHKMYPDQWTAEAKMVKAEAEAADGDDLDHESAIPDSASIDPTDPV